MVNRMKTDLKKKNKLQNWNSNKKVTKLGVNRPRTWHTPYFVERCVTRVPWCYFRSPFNAQNQNEEDLAWVLTLLNAQELLLAYRLQRENFFQQLTRDNVWIKKWQSLPVFLKLTPICSTIAALESSLPWLLSCFKQCLEKIVIILSL